MGKRRGWPEQLAARCRAVGWIAELTNSGHYKIQIPASEGVEGGGFSIASTPGSFDSEKKALNNANRYGLERLEKLMKLQAEKDRLERIEQDRERNGVPEEQYARVTPEPKKEDENVTKYGTVEVDGVKLGIAEVAKPVMHTHPRGGEPYALPHCRELLLVDDSIRYQCLKLVDADQVCARHFKTSGGLVVHWARSPHANEGRDLGGVLPVEPKPEAELEKLAILMDRVPSSIYTMPDPRGKPKEEPADDLVVPTGLVAQAVLQVGRLRILESSLDDLAQQAGSIASELERIVEKLPEELVSEDLLQKAAKFDRMMGALDQ